MRFGRHVEVHGLELREEVEDALQREVWVLWYRQVAHGLRRNEALGALDDVLEKVDGHRVEGRQVGLPVNGHWKRNEKQMSLTEGEDLPLVAEFRSKGCHVHIAWFHVKHEIFELNNIQPRRAIYVKLVCQGNPYRS